MVTVAVPSVEEIAQRPATPQTASLMTPLGVVEGEILTHLEVHGATPLRRLIRTLGWPRPMVLMAIGALVRAGLVRATPHDLEVIVEARHTAALFQAASGEGTSEVWGG